MLDEKGDFKSRCNLQMVGLEKFENDAEADQVRAMIQRHAELTQSLLAGRILALWQDMAPKLVKVLPKDYARVLASRKRVEALGLSGEEAVMAAFEENIRDVARIGGG